MLADWWPTLAIGGLALGAGCLVALPAAASLVSRKNAKKKQRADSGSRPRDSELPPERADARLDRQQAMAQGPEPWLSGAEPWRGLDLWDQPARFLAALLTHGYRDVMPWPEIMRLYRVWCRTALRPGEDPEREAYLSERLERLGCRRLRRLSEIGPPGSRKRCQMYQLPAIMTDGLPPSQAGLLPAPGTGDAAEPRSSPPRRLKAVS